MSLARLVDETEANPRIESDGAAPPLMRKDVCAGHGTELER